MIWFALYLICRLLIIALLAFLSPYRVETHTAVGLQSPVGFGSGVKSQLLIHRIVLLMAKESQHGVGIRASDSDPADPSTHPPLCHGSLQGDLGLDMCFQLNLLHRTEDNVENRRLL